MAEESAFGQHKDYTNICGSAFQPFVADQIEARKRLVSKDPRDNETLQWLDNKTAWMRVSSGVNVDVGNSNFKGLEGDLLSKKYILQAGLIDHTGANTNWDLRSGIGPDAAYGIGGNAFGLRPMPGITGISIKTGGKLGTLREATIDFVCYNKEQLDIMDALYMKLGMSVLVEWGHIPFIDNNGKLQTIPQPLPFYGIHTKEVLMKSIQKNRVTHAGNFDAMWGTIKNWSFSLEDNGIFKCQMSLVGAGDVLESLKINQSGKTKTTPSGNEVTGSPYPVVTDQNLSILNNALYDIWSKDILNTNYQYNHDFSDPYKVIITKYLEKLPRFTFGSDPTSNPELFCSTAPLIQHGFHYSLISGLNTALGNGGKDINIPQITPEKFFSRFIVGYEINGEEIVGGITEKDKGAEQVYITLGHLLMLIMATGGLFDKSQNSKDPYVYIDVNPETNLCYTFPGHISLDPTICLIGTQTLPFNISSDMIKVIQSNFPFFYPQQPSMGRFMYTLLNVQYIAGVLKSNIKKNPKGDVYFVDFIQEILAGVSKATGGYNEFRVVPDDDTRCVRIFDDKRIVPPLKETENSPYTIIPVMGKDSLAYSFNYTSRIPPNAATMIVISSQAEPTGANMPADALAFSKLRQGLTNRLASIRVDSTDNGADDKVATAEERAQAQKDEDSRFIELKDLIKGIYSGTGGTLTETEVTTQTNAAQSSMYVNQSQGFK
jgi:hypothetical protein